MPQTADQFIDQLFEAAADCSAQAKALLYVMLHWTNKLPRDRRGYLERDGRPISRERLAKDASLNSPGGSAPDPFQELKDAGVLDQDGRAFVMPHLRQLAAYRDRRAASTDHWREKASRVSRDTRKVSRDNHVTPSPPPPRSLSPTPPISNPPDPKKSLAKANDAAATPNAKPSLRDRAMGLWTAKWTERHHGADYGPSKVDWVKLSEILVKLKAKEEPERFMDRWGKVVETVLRQPEEFGWEGHRLAVVVQRWPFVVSETAKTEKGIRSGNHKPTAVERGEFPEERRPLPTARRSVAGAAGAGSNGANGANGSAA